MSEMAGQRFAVQASLRRTLIGLLLSALLCAIAPTLFAETSEFVRDDAPETYTVRDGDTLWDIARVFLTEPWRWTSLWRVNPEIEDPHLIYPGDTIRLSRGGDGPTLSLDRGARTLRLSPADTVRVEPRIRATPLLSNIPTIDLESIGQFLSANRVVRQQMLENAGYVVQGEAGRILVGANDQLYARRLDAEVGDAFSLLRSGGSFTHPDTGETLGLEAEELGTAQVIAIEGDLAIMIVTESRADIRIGDRLLPTEERPVSSSFFPSVPDAEVSGHMLSVLDGVSQIGQYSVVALDLGEREGIEVGHVLAVMKAGPLVRDRIANDIVRMPSTPGGLLMVFRVFEKVSYGIVLESRQPLAVLDEVTNP